MDENMSEILNRNPAPSVIAALMGLQEAASQQPVRKKPKVLCENYLRRVATIGVREKRVSSLSMEKHKECNFVFQILETLKREKCHSMPVERRKIKSNSSELKLESTKQKVAKAERVSEDKSFQLPNPAKAEHVPGNLSSSTGTEHFALDRHIMGITRSRSKTLKVKPKKMGCDVNVEIPMSQMNVVDTFASNSKLSTSSMPSLSYMNKKQILEKSKMTNELQHVEAASKSKALTEMLANADNESGRKILDCKPWEFSLSSKSSPQSGIMNFGTHSSISSWDGWRNRLLRGLPKPRSLLNDFDAAGHRIKRTNSDAFLNGRCKRAPMSVNSVENKWRGQDFHQNHSVGCRASTDSINPGINHPVMAVYEAEEISKNKIEDADSCGIGRVICSSLSEQKNEAFQDVTTIWKEHQKENRSKDLSDSVAYRSSTIMSFFSGMPADMVSNADTQAVKVLRCEDQHIQLNKCVISVKDGDSTCRSEKSVNQDISEGTWEEECTNLQWADMEPVSLAGLENSCQRSPVSVLDSLCTNDAQFKSFNVSSLDLNLQLELLKSETLDSYSEGSGMAVSSDEETEYGSVGDSEENEDLVRSFKAEEGRDFSYLIDVITEAGFHCAEFHMGFEVLHSKECPISYSVFETLEKKYGEQTSWNRSERRLLFDRINSGLMEILQPLAGMLAWKKSVERRLSGQGQEVNEDRLWMLFFGRGKQPGSDSSKYFGKDDKWLELADEFEAIGKEIEDSLIDELVHDVVSKKCF